MWIDTIIPIVSWVGMGIFVIRAIRNYNGWGY